MTRKTSDTHAPLSRVLVATDFSTGSGYALRRALLLPLAEGATIHVVHVLPARLPAEIRGVARSGAKRELDALAGLARADLAGRKVQVSTELLAGEPFVEIIQRSRSLEAELIVLGRHGRQRASDVFLGTTAERVVRKGDVPVLIASLDPSGPYRKPAIATDLEDGAHRAFGLALRVLGPAVKRIHVVHAFEVPYEGTVSRSLSAAKIKEYRAACRKQAAAGLEALLTRYADAGIEWTRALRPGDARSVVLAELERRRTDLVAIGTHGRSGIARALLGSVAERIIASAGCDVLAARPVRFSFKLP